MFNASNIHTYMLAKWKSKVILLHKACLQTCMYVSRHTYIIKNALILTKYLKKHSVFVFLMFLSCFLVRGSIFFDFFSLDERVCPKSMAPGSLKLRPLSRFRHVTFISSRRNRRSVFNFSNVFTVSPTFFASKSQLFKCIMHLSYFSHAGA